MDPAAGTCLHACARMCRCPQITGYTPTSHVSDCERASRRPRNQQYTHGAYLWWGSASERPPRPTWLLPALLGLVCGHASALLLILRSKSQQHRRTCTGTGVHGENTPKIPASRTSLAGRTASYGPRDDPHWVARVRRIFRHAHVPLYSAWHLSSTHDARHTANTHTHCSRTDTGPRVYIPPTRHDLQQCQGERV